MIAALAVLSIGVIVAVNMTSSAHPKSRVAQLKAVLETAPLPADTHLVEEKSNEANGDLAAYAERQYRLASATDPSAQIRAALARAGYQLVDGQTGDVTDVTSSAWSAFAGATNGDVNVLPPGSSGGGIEYLWQGDKLYLSLREGNIH